MTARWRAVDFLNGLAETSFYDLPAKSWVTVGHNPQRRICRRDPTYFIHSFDVNTKLIKKYKFFRPLQIPRAKSKGLKEFLTRGWQLILKIPAKFSAFWFFLFCFLTNLLVCNSNILEGEYFIFFQKLFMQRRRILLRGSAGSCLPQTCFPTIFFSCNY